MSLHRENRLGIISISNNIFAAVIRDGMLIPDCRGRVWPATKKGKQIGNDAKVNLNDFGSSIEVEDDEDGPMKIKFSIIIKFGSSISGITSSLSDYIAEAVGVITDKKTLQITIHVSGVKSRQIAKRNTEVIKTYEVDGQGN